jgi:flagellar assembly factor FliW
MSEPALSPNDDSVILFEEGVIGVPRARRFQLLQRQGSAVRVLRCLDVEGFNLPVIDPRLAWPEYRPRLGPRVAAALGWNGDESALLVLAVTALEPTGAVANLRAPLVINVQRRLAAQVILEDRSHPLRAPVAAAAPEREFAAGVAR